MLTRPSARVIRDARGAVLWKLASGTAIALAMLLMLEVCLRLVWHYAGSVDSSVTELGNRNDPSARHIALPTSIVEELGSSQRFGVQSNVLTYPDARLLFHVRPNPTNAPVYCYEGIDPQGFRTASSLEKLRKREGGDALRVLILGDSCAFGWDICRFDLTIGAQLEGHLAAEGRRAEVINLAQPGYSTAQGLLLFQQWFPELRPDFVVLYFGWNDRFPTLGLTDAQILRLMPVAASPWAQTLMHTALYRTFAWAASPLLPTHRRALPSEPGIEHVRVPVEQSVANVRAMIDGAKTGGASVIVVLPAHGPQFRNRELHIDPFNQAVAEAATADAFVVHLPAMEAGSAEAATYFGGDGFHPSARGARYIAEAIAGVIHGRSPESPAPTTLSVAGRPS